MKFRSLALLASSLALAFADDMTEEEMKQTHAQYTKDGLCFYYEPPNKSDWTTCYDKCGYGEGEGSLGCKGAGIDYWYTDNESRRWQPGECLCDEDLQLATEIANVVIEGLSHLDEVLCAVVFEAIQTTVEYGLMAVPGGFAASQGMRVGIEAAKEIAVNGLGTDEFKNWYDGFCPSGDIGQQIHDIWTDWTSVPASIIPTGACVKNNKKCRNLDEDPKKDGKDHSNDDKPKSADPPKSDTPKTTDKPEATSATDGPASATSASATETASASATPAACYMYTALSDDGPDGDLGLGALERRDVAGRVLVPRARNPPSAFGTCTLPAGFSFGYNDEAPKVKTILNNHKLLDTNGAKNKKLEAVPRWYSLEQNCNGAPKLIKEDDTDEKDKQAKEGRFNKYNVDHIWEINFLKAFIESLVPTVATPGTINCDDFTAFFFSGATVTDSPTEPMSILYGLIPMVNEPSNPVDQYEFAAMRTVLNGKKGRMLNPLGLQNPAFKTAQMKTTKDKLDIIRQVSIAMEVCNEDEIVTLWNRAQARIYKYLSERDAAVKTASITFSKADFSFATAFQDWMASYLDDRADAAWRFIDDTVKDIDGDIKKMGDKTDKEKADKKQYQDWLDVFTKSTYSSKGHYKFKWDAKAV